MSEGLVGIFGTIIIDRRQGSRDSTNTPRGVMRAWSGTGAYL